MSSRQGETKDLMQLQRSTSLTSIPASFLVSFRVRLSKRRAKAGTQSTTNAVLVCKHRDMNEKELEAQVSVTDTWLNIHRYTCCDLSHDNEESAVIAILVKFLLWIYVVMHGGVVTVLLRFVFLRKLAKLSWRTMSQKTKRKIWTWIKTPRNLVGVITHFQFS